MNLLTENIQVHCQIDTRNKEVKGDVHINFESVKPFVEFIKIVDGKQVAPKLRFTFKIDTAAILEGLKFKFSSIASDSAITRKSRNMEISLDKFSLNMTVSIIKLPTVTLVEPVFLFHKEQFKVKNLHFFLSR